MNDFLEIKAKKNIKNGIKNELKEYSDNFCWSIKFNVPLLMQSVNSKTTNITNEYGEVVNAKIFYVPFDNIIAIQPQEKYANDVYYFLNISKEVCSENGKNFKEEIHIRFKLKNKNISELKTFKGLLKFKKIPLSIRLNLPYFKILLKPFGKFGKLNKYEHKIPKVIMPYFILPFISCIIVFFLMPKYISHILGFGTCFVLTLIQIVIFIIEYKSKRRKSVNSYNKGASYFNSRQILDALDYFEEAYKLDNNNTLAQMAIVRVNKYL